MAVQLSWDFMLLVVTTTLVTLLGESGLIPIVLQLWEAFAVADSVILAITQTQTIALLGMVSCASCNIKTLEILSRNDFVNYSLT
jgi:hypothetical protein